MHHTHKAILGKAGIGLALLTAVGLGGRAQAGTVGDIQAFYNAPNTFGVGVIDAPAFVFENTSSSAITDSIFTIGANSATAADTFNIGTIAAGSNFILIPGQSNDGGTGHSFFAFTGGPRDTSDSGPEEGTVPFAFTGLQNGVTISSGIFTPDQSARPAGDGSVSSINFLGGPNDGPCNDCFDPTQVATLSTPNPVPEASITVSFGLLLALGLGGLAVSARRRKAQAGE